MDSGIEGKTGGASRIELSNDGRSTCRRTGIPSAEAGASRYGTTDNVVARGLLAAAIDARIAGITVQPSASLAFSRR